MSTAPSSSPSTAATEEVSQFCSFSLKENGDIVSFSFSFKETFLKSLSPPCPLSLEGSFTLCCKGPLAPAQIKKVKKGLKEASKEMICKAKTGFGAPPSSSSKPVPPPEKSSHHHSTKRVAAASAAKKTPPPPPPQHPLSSSPSSTPSASATGSSSVQKRKTSAEVNLEEAKKKKAPCSPPPPPIPKERVEKWQEEIDKELGVTEVEVQGRMVTQAHPLERIMEVLSKSMPPESVKRMGPLIVENERKRFFLGVIKGEKAPEKKRAKIEEEKEEEEQDLTLQVYDGEGKYVSTPILTKEEIERNNNLVLGTPPPTPKDI